MSKFVMREIHITAEDTESTIKQIQNVIGGTIESRWGEHILTVDNAVAKGAIRYIVFEWGGDFLYYDIAFFEDIVLKKDTSVYNPISFIYCLNGHFKHRFNHQDNYKTLEQFQSVIMTSKNGGYSNEYYPKGIKLEVNVIQINRIKFLNKRLNDASILNDKLYKVFYDTDYQNVFSYYGTYNLKLADHISQFRKVEQKGMLRILLIEGQVYQVLSLHMQQHNKAVTNKPISKSLTKNELKTIRALGNTISNNVSLEYSLEKLSLNSGLAQAKLQEGFKLLYARTVTEYIRHVRLEKARDLINTSDLNISEIVYTIGFSSRSYFSKIFKNKYKISPSAFQKNKRR